MYSITFVLWKFRNYFSSVVEKFAVLSWQFASLLLCGFFKKFGTKHIKIFLKSLLWLYGFFQYFSRIFFLNFPTHPTIFRQKALQFFVLFFYFFFIGILVLCLQRLIVSSKTVSQKKKKRINNAIFHIRNMKLK